MTKWVAVYWTGDDAYYLRGTVWTSDPSRANRYETESDALNALQKSAKFNPKAAKQARVVQDAA